MLISVFTPLSESGNQYIKAAFETLLTQTHTDWEWIVVENHGGKLPAKIRQHPKVRCYGNSTLEGIGALKGYACSLGKGEILFELDHDDLLHEEALAETALALQDADFAVSDFAEFHTGTWAPNIYSADFGWKHNYPVTFQGHELICMPNPSLTPQNLCNIQWAPNHLRAWRTEAYKRVGGHDANLPLADDHDLVSRCYLAGLRFKHIKKCLYFYRVHPKQTVQAQNAVLQDACWNSYDKHIFGFAGHFADTTPRHYDHWDGKGKSPQRGPPTLRKIDLCGGIDTMPGYEPLDLSLGHDLNQQWPLADDSVGVIRAFDAIEHLRDPIHVMNEAYRVLAPGGFFLIHVPSTDGRGAWQDPTHVSFWNENSFWYYTRSSHSRYIPAYKGRFQERKLRSFFPNPWHRENHIPYVEAHLIALKDGYEPMGPVQI